MWTPPEPYWTSEPNAEGDIYRVTPPENVANGEDAFIHSMYKNYATQQVVLNSYTGEEVTTGKVVITKADALALAHEIVSTHKDLEEHEVHNYVDEQFPQSWATYDVNGEGEIDIGLAPMFARHVLQDSMAHLYPQRKLE